MAGALFLLDTNVVLYLIRGQQLGQHLANTFNLLHSAVRPLISIVSCGELLVLADRNVWGHARRAAMAACPRHPLPAMLPSTRKQDPRHHNPGTLTPSGELSPYEVLAPLGAGGMGEVCQPIPAVGSVASGGVAIFPAPQVRNLSSARANRNPRPLLLSPIIAGGGPESARQEIVAVRHKTPV